jgi:hypothetical protein
MRGILFPVQMQRGHAWRMRLPSLPRLLHMQREERPMKKLLMTAATLLVFAAPGHADQLPAIYLGQWCAYGDEPDSAYFAVTPEGKKCGETHLLTIKRNELIEGVETGCRFQSIKKTSDLRAPHTKATKAELVPVMEVVARFSGEGGTQTYKLRLIYQKGDLTIESNDQ